MGAIRGSQVIYNSSLQFALSIPYGAGATGIQYQNGVAIGGTPVTWAYGSSSIGVQWFGGRTMVHFNSDGVFPPAAANLQIQLQQPGGNWLQVGSGIFPVGITNANMFAFDSVPGQYRVFSNSGLTQGLNIVFTGIDYGQ